MGNVWMTAPRKSTWFLRHKEFGVLVALVILIIAFSFFSNRFLTFYTLLTVITMASELGVVAVGVSLLMISGEFDLSVGATFALCPLVFILLFSELGFPVWAAFILALAVGGLCGLLNGMLVTKVGLPSFIASLGMMMFWRGIVLAVSGGQPMVYFGEYQFIHLLSGRLIFDIRFSAIWFVVVTLIFWVLLEKTKYGNWVYAAGGNPEVARYLGARPDRVKLKNFVVVGILAGLGGCLLFARLGSVSPAQGEGLELETIAAAVIGGNLLAGGYGTILGTSLAVFLVAMVNAGLVMAGAPTYWYRSFVGLIIIIAVVINLKLRKRAVQ